MCCAVAVWGFAGAAVNSKVISYVTEEVWRQGHDVEGLDGIERVSWMLEAWCYADRMSSGKLYPDITDAWNIGRLVEQEKNKMGFRSGGVRVGNRVCPPASKVFDQLWYVMAKAREYATPLDFYRAFEEVHPFFDGNGRTGKILMNWVGKSLGAPVFPPNDFWGHPIQNP